MDRHAFRDPGKAYRGVTLWMLNDALDIPEIARQLDGLDQAGFGAMIGRTFNGLRTEYLSDAWMDIIDTIIQGASKHDMKVWLQAGYMPSGVPELDPASAHQGIALRAAHEPAHETELRVLATHDGQAITLRRLDSVLDLLNRDAVTQYLDKAYIQTWHGRFGEHFGKTVEAVWVDEPHFRPPLLPWSDTVPDAFAKQWGYDVTDHVTSLLFPVGDYHRIRHHYWRTVTALLLDGYFRPVGDWSRENDVKFAGHLMGEDTLANQIGFTGATMPCYEPMQLPGIDHLTMSLYWPSRKKFILTPKQCASAANQLGTAEVLAEMFGVSSPGISFEDRKQIANWMAALGINYRCYHGSFYSLRGRRKRIYAPHLSHQQPWWPDNHLEADPFARLSYALRRGRTIADVCVLHPVESTYCLYDALSMFRPHDRSTENADVREQDDRLVQLCDNLLSIQRDFELGDETLMARHGRVEGDRLCIGRARYKLVALPAMITLRASTLELLERFVEAGGTILATGALPTRLDGETDAGVTERLERIVTEVHNDPDALRSAIDAAVAREISVTSRAAARDARHVWVHGRACDDGRRVYFITNINREQGVEVDVTFHRPGRLEAWDLDSADVADAPQRAGEGDTVTTTLHLPPVGSALLVQYEHEPARDIEPTAWREVRRVALPATGRIEPDAPNALTLDVARLRKGDGAFGEAVPVMRIQNDLQAEGYEGPVTLRFTFAADYVPDDLRLVIEDAAEYDIRVNDQRIAAPPTAKPVGEPAYIDHSFHPVAIAGAARVGENVIELTRRFSPLPQARFALAKLFENQQGVELESVYLIGSFEARGAISMNEPRARCVRHRPGFVLDEPRTVGDADFTANGYAFYAGRMRFTQQLRLEAPADGERVVLELPSLDAALVKLRVNGRDAPSICWPPYQSDITRLVSEGENTIELEFVSTLRNLLGPHHRAAGEPDNTWHTAWSPDGDVKLREHPEEASGWTDDYFSLHLGLRAPATVSYLEPAAIEQSHGQPATTAAP